MRGVMEPLMRHVHKTHVREDGKADNTKVLVRAGKAAEAACITKALRRGAFTCTGDGKAAKVRIAMAWPARAR